VRENRTHGSEGGDGESRFRPLSPKIATISISLAGEALPWQAGFFRDAEHEIEVLNRHAGRAFAEIIQPGH
jgi:hypothetical protein